MAVLVLLDNALLLSFTTYDDAGVVLLVIGIQHHHLRYVLSVIS